MSPRQPARRPVRAGAAAVEFAVLLSILAVLLLGLWEFGRLLWIQQSLSCAAREGARQASMGVKSPDEVRQHVRMYLQRAGLNTTGMPDPEIFNLTNPARSDPRLGQQLDRYRVRVTLPLANNRWILFSYLADNLTGESVFACTADVPVSQPSEDIPS
jgi:hypothetical protein